MSTTKRLSDGQSIPLIGYGTYPMRGSAAVESVLSALDVGYRLLDTAFNYDNEAAVGRAVALTSVPREKIFVVSKLPGRYHERPEADSALRESLWRMGLDYLDMYLIHWPNPNRGQYVAAWRALIAAREEGLVRSIGVSNFTVEQLRVLEEETGVLPVANQIECHPYFPQTSQIAAHEQMGVQTISWSPLGKRSKPGEEPVIEQIAASHSVSPAQVIIRWQLQRNCIPIPKSANRKRMADNYNVFDFQLSELEMEQITALGRSDGRLFDGDPNTHEEL